MKGSLPMTTFSQANQVRIALKMSLAKYSWYKSSIVNLLDDGYGVVVTVKSIDNNRRKLVPPLIDSVYIKIESDN